MSGRGRSRRGTPGRGRARGLIPGPGHIVPPADLGPEALEIWEELAPEVARFGLIHGEGAGLLAEYCRLSVQWQEVHARMRGEGAWTESPRGLRALKDLLRINHRLLDLGDRLGMSPLARARMGLR
jgi:P27 family predicted phage terminase small subunit